MSIPKMKTQNPRHVSRFALNSGDACAPFLSGLFPTSEMNMLVRCCLTFLLSFATCAFAQSPAQSPPYPSGPVKIISPFATGGIADTFARVIAQHLADTYHQPFVVENKTGGGGNIGADLVAKAAPHGNTLVMGSIGTQAVNQYLVKDMPYDPIRDFVPVAYVMNAEGLLVINPSVPANNVGELIELLRSQPGKFSFASGGTGTSGHLAGELLKSMAKVDIVHVPYKGNTLAINDLIGGQTQMMFATMPTVLPFVKSGRLKALAVSGRSRSDALPQVPTVAETLPGFDVANWIGLFAPAGTPGAIVDKLNAEVNKVMQEPAVLERLQAEGATFSPMTPQQFGAFQRAEADKWGALVRGLKLD